MTMRDADSQMWVGARAAMIRERNPETWFAGWASSAPVEAQIDMSVYFNPMEQVGHQTNNILLDTDPQSKTARIKPTVPGRPFDVLTSVCIGDDT